MTQQEYSNYVAFLDRNSDATLTLHIETGDIDAYHRHWEFINGRIQVFERFDKWISPKP